MFWSYTNLLSRYWKGPTKLFQASLHLISFAIFFTEREQKNPSDLNQIIIEKNKELYK